MLSIIIPALNEEKYLPILLKEIQKQNFQDYEIIVADAGSKDKTEEIAKKFGCKIAAGGSSAKGRNEGAKVARGELLLFMDADYVFLPPHFLKNLIAEFQKRKLDIASFPIFVVGNKFDKLAYKIYNKWAKASQNFRPYASSAILVKKEIHQKIGGFDEEIKLAEDHFYARTATKFGKFGFIKTEPVLASARRLEKDGRVKTYSKYLLAGAYMLKGKPIKSDIFKYKFDHYKKNKVE